MGTSGGRAMSEEQSDKKIYQNHESRIAEIEKKITWLSEENAKLYTQVDDDALKRAENSQEISEIKKRFGDLEDNWEPKED